MEQVIRLGFLVPATNAVMEPEMYKLAPEGVTIHFERFIPKTVPGENRTSDSLSTLFRFLEELAEDTPRAVKAVAVIHPKVVVFGCTSGSFWGGEVKLAANPIKMEGLSEEDYAAAPTLDQHGHEIV